MKIVQSISNLGSRFLAAFALITTLLIALAFLMSLFHSYLQQFVFGSLVELTLLLVVAGCCVAGLIGMRRKDRVAVRPEVEESSVFFLALDFQNVGMKFVQGFIIGLTSEKNSERIASAPVYRSDIESRSSSDLQ